MLGISFWEIAILLVFGVGALALIATPIVFIILFASKKRHSGNPSASDRSEGPKALGRPD